MGGRRFIVQRRYTTGFFVLDRLFGLLFTRQQLRGRDFRLASPRIGTSFHASLTMFKPSVPRSSAGLTNEQRDSKNGRASNDAIYAVRLMAVAKSATICRFGSRRLANDTFHFLFFRRQTVNRILSLRGLNGPSWAHFGKQDNIVRVVTVRARTRFRAGHVTHARAG